MNIVASAIRLLSVLLLFPLIASIVSALSYVWVPDMAKWKDPILYLNPSIWTIILLLLGLTILTIFASRIGTKFSSIAVVQDSHREMVFQLALGTIIASSLWFLFTGLNGTLYQASQYGLSLENSELMQSLSAVSEATKASYSQQNLQNTALIRFLSSLSTILYSLFLLVFCVSVTKFIVKET